LDFEVCGSGNRFGILNPDGLTVGYRTDNESLSLYFDIGAQNRVSNQANCPKARLMKRPRTISSALHTQLRQKLCQMVLITGLTGMCLPLPPAVAQENAVEESGDSDPEFRPRHVLPRQPAIVHPPMLPASAVTNQVTESDLVLGVVVNGQARAYPINMLNGPRREIINDTLGDQPIVAMWCHLCHSAIVFDRRVDNQMLTFQVSGMLWNRTLVMYDSETKSLWSLLLEKGVRGPMTGRKLTTLPSELTTWKKWKSLHPETTVLNMSHMQDRFVREFYDEPHPFV
jgi:hypothetical protein